jgi:uncharacterized protein (DUF433 family)
MSTLSLNEAAVIVDADAEALRADIKREIITPLRSEIAGRNRPIFAWEDLGCLATLYDARNADLMAPDVRRKTFRAYRAHVVSSVAANWHEAAEKIRECLAVIVTRQERRRARGAEQPREVATEKWMLYLDEILCVDIKPAADRIGHAAEVYARGLERIASDPERMGGAPVFVGTRLPVRHIGLMAERGAPLAEILDDYPELTGDDVEFARLYAKANPAMGRPRGEVVTGGNEAPR